jgi:hypothetical protein
LVIIAPTAVPAATMSVQLSTWMPFGVPPSISAMPPLIRRYR